MLKAKSDLTWRFYYENKECYATQGLDKESGKGIEYISTTYAAELLYGMFYRQTFPF